MRPTQEWKQAGGWPVSSARIAEDALLRLARLPVEVDLLVRAGGDARAPAAAGLLVDQHHPVLAPFGQCARGAGGDAARVRAVVADPRQVHHRQALDLEQRAALVVGEPVQVRVVFGVDGRAGEVVVPVGAAVDVDRPAGELGDRRRGRLSVAGGGGEEVAVAVGPRLVVVVEAGLVGVVEELGEAAQPALGAQGELAAADLPPSPVLLLVLPARGVAGAGLGLDVVPPHGLGAGALGPDVLAGDRAGVAPDALVQVEDHRGVGTDVHGVAPSVQAQAGGGALRITTNVSRLTPGGPQ